MPYFINDQESLGLWICIAYSDTISDYKNSNFKEDIENLSFKYLYFLNNGKGFGNVVDWSKGVINVGFKNTHTYTIENDKLFLNFVDTRTNEHIRTVIYENVDNKKRDIAEPIFKDGVKLDFIEDKNVLGLWEIYDVVHRLDKDKYSPINPKDMSICFYQSITFKTNGKCIKEQFTNFITQSYTKGKVLNKKQKIAEDYKIINYNNEQYLLLDTKNEDYSFDNLFTWTYVFKKV